MTACVDKIALANRFGKAADSYDQFALLQKEVGRHLLSLIPEQHYGKGLDLGCGSGFFLHDLRELCEDLTAADLSTGMLHKAKTHQVADQLICGDAESLPFQNEIFDLVFTSLAIQWCNDLAQAFAEITRVLRAQGFGLFATLTRGSLSELRQAWAEVDDLEHVNTFISANELALQLHKANARCVSLDVVQHTINYPDVHEILRSLKGIGASQVNGNRNQGLITRKQLIALEKAYEQFRKTDGMLPVTYNVCYGVICR